MTLQDRVLNIIRQKPGTAKSELSLMFGLSDYRLNRVLRQLQRELPGQILAHHEENGVWIVDLDTCKCKGLVWLGRDNGGYKQCSREPEFDDGRCYDHSQYESPDMVAFARELAYRAGPTEPRAYELSQLGMHVVEDLTANLERVVARTRREKIRRQELLEILRASLAFIRQRRRTRRLFRDDWIPPELRSRHRASSVSPFEYSLKKYFALLEVSPDSSRKEVLAAWRRLARRYHPDTRDGDDERMKAINLAKERIFRLRRWG